MYKKQMRFQKVFCFIALFASVLVFIYSLGIMTDLYDTLYTTMMDPTNIDDTWVPGSQVYYHMQGFNKSLLSASIVMIILAVLLFITNTDKRRKYYVANYISTGLFSVFTVCLSFWAHSNIQVFRAEWKALDFAALRDFADMFKSAYTESTFWFDAHYLVFGISLVAVCLLIFNVYWKICLMKEEKRLVEGGK